MIINDDEDKNQIESNKNSNIARNSAEMNSIYPFISSNTNLFSSSNLVTSPTNEPTNPEIIGNQKKNVRTIITSDLRSRLKNRHNLLNKNLSTTEFEETTLKVED